MINSSEQKAAELYNQIDNLFVNTGLFQKVAINDRINYVGKGGIFRIDYDSTLGFIIQYTDDLWKAKRNVYVNSNPYPLSFGPDMLEVISQDILKKLNS